MTPTEHGPTPENDSAPGTGFPTDEAVLGTPYALPWPIIHPIGTPHRSPHHDNRLWRAALFATIIISLIGLILSAAVIATRLFPSRHTLDATGQSAALGIQFRYPGEWHTAEQSALNLFGTPATTVLIADRPLNRTPNAARLVLALQRIDPTEVFGIPAVCHVHLADGPHRTFDCMAQAGYAVPVYDAFSGTSGATRLAGTLPPTPATRPLILLPSSSQQWMAVTIIYWDHVDSARDHLARIARSIRPTR